MKDLKISKELLSEVLGYEVDVFLSVTENEIDYTCCRDKNIGYEDISINIYKFAFLCKEWALTKGYKIQSQINYENKGHSHISKISENEWAKGFLEDTEVKAVIKASEYVLKELNENR